MVMAHCSSWTHSFFRISCHWTSRSLVVIIIVFLVIPHIHDDDQELAQSEFIVLLLPYITILDPARYQYPFHRCWFHTCELTIPLSVNDLHEHQLCSDVARSSQVIRGVMFKWALVGCSSLTSSSSMRPCRWTRLDRVIIVIGGAIVTIVMAAWIIRSWVKVYYLLRWDDLVVQWIKDRCSSLRRSFVMISCHWTNQSPVPLLLWLNPYVTDSIEQEFPLETYSVVSLILTLLKLIFLSHLSQLNLLSAPYLHAEWLYSSGG